jgi:hypothetical protein
MPNHIKNRITILGTSEQVEEVLDKFSTYYPAELARAIYGGGIICNHKSDSLCYGWFDEKTGTFSRRGKDPVVGLPEEYVFQINQAWTHFPDFEKVIPPPENIFKGDLGEKERKECEESGRPNWYDWNISNWGTKWNSYSCKKESWNIFTFETAWSGVPGIIQEMSKLCPDITLEYEYSDEDIGSNCGVGKAKAGELELERFTGYSKEAYEIAFKLRPECKNDYVLNEHGTYEYKDDEEE